MSSLGQFRSRHSLAGPRSQWPDLLSFYELDQKYFPNPWTIDNWDKLLNHSAQDIYLGHIQSEQAQVIGFILYLLNPTDHFAHLVKVLSVPDVVRNGLGHQMLTRSEDELRQLQITHFFLEVEADNTPAIGLYQKCGYQRIHTQRDFYGNGRDALIMERRD